MSGSRTTRGSAGGRPRADGTSSANARDEIIAVATRLFAERGYAETTMTHIAKEVGLRQASLYYWFSNKEQLLQEIAALNRFAVAVVHNLEKLRAPAAVKLYRLLYEDTRYMCLGPCDYNEIERLAYQRRAEFDVFWSDYELLHNAITDLIARGMKSRDFVRQPDVGWAAATALTFNEGVQKLYRNRHRGAASEDGPRPSARDGIEFFCHHSATTFLTTVLPDRDRLDAIRTAGMALDIDVES